MVTTKPVVDTGIQLSVRCCDVTCMHACVRNTVISDRDNARLRCSIVQLHLRPDKSDPESQHGMVG